MNDVSSRGTLTLASAEACDRGKVREENQDNVRSARIPLGELLIVADGIGGYQGGATASRMVVEGFLGQLAVRTADAAPDQALKEASAFTNASIFNTAGSTDPKLHRMGSTVVLALVQLGAAGVSRPVAWVGHVGDSRAYLIRNGQMQKITMDHSAVQSLISRNLITEEEARNHPDASVLTRSLGHRPEVEIEIDRVLLEAGDALLLCSDGLWGYVSDPDIAAVATDSTLSVETIADALLHQALAAGGQDNIGIEFVRLSGAPARAMTASPMMPSAPQRVTASSPPGGPAASVVQGKSPASRHRKLQLLAVGLLLLGGCGYLGYSAVSRGWFNPSHWHKQADNDTPKKDAADKATVPPPDHDKKTDFQPPKDKNRVVTPGVNPGAPKPAQPQQHGLKKRIAVVGDIRAAQHDIGSSEESKDWLKVPITEKNSPACLSHAKEGPVVYVDERVDVAEAIKVIVELELSANNAGQKIDKSVEQHHRMPPEITRDCGSYEAVIFLPKKAAASGGQAAGTH